LYFLCGVFIECLFFSLIEPGNSPKPFSGASQHSEVQQQSSQPYKIETHFKDSPNAADIEKIRLQERKSKVALHSYLTFSLDSAEEAISVEKYNHSSSSRRLSSSPVPESKSSSSHQNIYSSSRRTKKISPLTRRSPTLNPASYFYNKNDLPAGHDIQLIHSPYYRALFGNTAALPFNQSSTTDNSTPLKSESTESINSSPGMMTGSQDDSGPRVETISSCSSEASSSDEEQHQFETGRAFKRNLSSVSNIILKRSHSNSSHNLRKLAHHHPSQGSQSYSNFFRMHSLTENEDVGDESNNQMNDHVQIPFAEAKDAGTTVVDESSWPTLPSLSSDATPISLRYQPPELKSPETSSQLLFESKQHPPSSAQLPSSYATSLLSYNNPSTPKSSLQHMKQQRSPSMYEMNSSAKKRIRAEEGAQLRTVININEEGKDTTQSSIQFTTPVPPVSSSSAKDTLSSSPSPFRQELPSNLFFSPPQVIMSAGISSSLSLPAFSTLPHSSVNMLQSPFLSQQKLDHLNPQQLQQLQNQTPHQQAQLLRAFSNESDQMGSFGSIEEVEDEEALVFASTSGDSVLAKTPHIPSSSSGVKLSSSVATHFRQPLFTSERKKIILPEQSPSKVLVDKVKVAQFIYSKLISSLQPDPCNTNSFNSSSTTATRVKRWDDPDTDSDEENDGNAQEGAEMDPKESFDFQFFELISDYTQLNISSELFQEKKQKNYFLFHGKQNYRCPSTSPKGKQNTPKRNSSLKFQDIDFLWFHKLIGNFLKEENAHYFDAFLKLNLEPQLWQQKKQHDDPTVEMLTMKFLSHSFDESKDEFDDFRRDSLQFPPLFSSAQQQTERTSSNALKQSTSVNAKSSNDNDIHKILRLLVSNKFYHYLFSLLPHEDVRFQSKIYELIKIVYVQIHENDSKLLETINQQKDSYLIKYQYLKKLINRQFLHSAQFGSVPGMMNDFDDENRSNLSNASSMDELFEGKSPKNTQLGNKREEYMHSYDSFDSIYSFSYCNDCSSNSLFSPLGEDGSINREIPFILLESLYHVSTERFQRCASSSKQSFQQELDVNFIAQKGFLVLSSENSTTEVDKSLHLHYSLHSTVKSKEERQPFRINDSDYYLIEFMKFVLKYEMEYLVSRLYKNSFDLTLIIKNLMIVKYLFLSLAKIMQCYGNRLGNSSELLENNLLLNNLLELMEGIILFYSFILFELESFENNLVNKTLNCPVKEPRQKKNRKKEQKQQSSQSQPQSCDTYDNNSTCSTTATNDHDSSASAKDDNFVNIILQKIYLLISSSNNSYQNSNNIFYLLLHFINSEWILPPAAAGMETGTRKNYAQEILLIKLFELSLFYLPPEKLLFPIISIYDNIQNHPQVINTSKTASIVQFPSLSFTTTNKVMFFMKQLFRKLFSSLNALSHFKILQTVLCFFFQQKSILLYNYCFAVDFSMYLENYSCDEVENDGDMLKQINPNCLSVDSFLNSPRDNMTPRNERNGNELTEKVTSVSSYQNKFSEARLFNEQNENRLNCLVDHLRSLRSEYWNPTIKSLANSLLDLIFYQMEQMQNEENNNDNSEDDYY
jgi:hypothetical protein